MDACKLLLTTHIPTIISKHQNISHPVAPVQTRARRPLRLSVRANAFEGSKDVFNGSGVYTPLQVTSPVGKYLSTLLHCENSDYFESAVKHKLLCLTNDREQTMKLLHSVDTIHGNPKLCKSVRDGVNREIEPQVEEAIYMLICRRFFETGVHMLPRISDCIVDGRLELSTSKDCLLECVHTPDVLELIKSYITRVTGLNANSSVIDIWKLIQIDHCYLTMIYTFAVLQGHFLKSASSRYALELLFDEACDSSYTFKSYALGFPEELRLIHSVPKSVEANKIMAKHIKALFDQVNARLGSTKGIVTTSPGTLRRLVLEGFTFGTFLWDTENFVNKFYKLDDESTLPVP